MKSIGVRICRPLLATIVTLALALSVSIALADGDMRLLWSDEFDGNAVDATKWQFDTGNILKNYLDGSLIDGAWGWGNYEKQFYQKENASVADGVLRIEARKETKSDPVEGAYDYTSARLTTRGRFSFTYGRLEVRMRCEAGNTLWPAIWMLPEKNTYAASDQQMWPENGEIDVIEFKGQVPRRAHTTLHYGNPYKYLTRAANLRSGDMTQWHVYALEWDENRISWFVDGKIVYTASRWYTTGAPKPAPFDQNFFININLAVGGNFAGKTGGAADPATFADGPKAMEVDYVRVYTRAEEPVEPEQPYLRIKKVPRYGVGSPVKTTGDVLIGNAFNDSGRKLDASGYKVVAYLQTDINSTFYVKPYYNAPLTSLTSNGYFKVDMVTSEYDLNAITYVVLLVDKSYEPRPVVSSVDVDALLKGAIDAQVIRRAKNGTYTIDARIGRPEPQTKK